MCSTACRQLRLLLWKNWILHRRNKLVTLIELLLPIVFSFLILAIRYTVKPTVYDLPTEWPAFGIAELPTSLTPKVNRTRPWSLAYTPDSALTAAVMNRVVASSGGRIIEAHGFRTEAAMIDTLAQNGTVRALLGGVVFSLGESARQLPERMEYKIRLPYLPRNVGKDKNQFGGGEGWMTQFTFPQFQAIGPREKNHTEGGSPGYYREGFLTVQLLVDRALMAELGHPDSGNVTMQRIPYPPYTRDAFLLVIQQQLSFLLLLGFIFTALNITKQVVHEKERRLKESMKMMGLQSWLHWTAWFINYFVMLAIDVLGVVAICYIPTGAHGRVLSYSNALVVILFLLLYVATIIFFCFAVSVFFNSARAGASAGGLLFLLSYIPYSFIQQRYSSVSLGLKVLSCVLPNMGLALGCQLIGMFEGTGAGVQWDNFAEGVSVDDSFTMAHVCGMFLFDCVFYMAIAWYKEGVRPGEFGIPQPWYFPFSAKYWCGTSPGGLRTEVFPDDSEINVSGERGGNPNVERDPLSLNCTVSLHRLTKVFGSGAKRKVAVDGLSINFYEGQITALLGHNGAGKTTTMSMIAGFIPSTSGQISINGLDIQHNLAAVRRQLGLCPQHDVLFDQLTVEEHLRFFARLKNFREDLLEAEVDRLISAVHLDAKRDWLAKALSGGMKRKLSVAIALVGGSKIVILDEPTSGMDPSARRDLWTFLQAERSRCTMLLSTHFMDEADFLGDRIAIMASGEVQCCGSSLFLKSRYGAGYHLTLVKSAGCHPKKVMELIHDHVPSARLESDIGDELAVVLPTDAAASFEALFSRLEEQRDELGVSSYGASVTTMEEVFLKVGEKEDSELAVPGLGPLPQPMTNGIDGNSVSSTSHLVGASVEDYAASKNRGFRLIRQQFWAIFVKRFIHSRRNYLISVTQLLVPIFFTVVGLLILKTRPGVANSPPLTVDLSHFGRQVVSYAGASDSVLAAYLSQFRSRADTTLLNLTSSADGLVAALARIGTNNLGVFNRDYIIAADFSAETTALFNDQPFHAPPISLNAITNAKLKASAGRQFSISTVNAPQPMNDFDKVSGRSSDLTGLSTAINVVFGMAFLASSFAVFLVRERSSKVKHLHFVAGTSKYAYWLGTLAWDMVNFLVPCIGILIVFIAFQEDAYSSTAGRVFGLLLLLLLYGWAVIPQTYVGSYIFQVPSTALVWLGVFNFITGLATLVTVTVLKIPQLDLEDTSDTLRTIFTIIFPNFCLGQAMVDYYSNYVYSSVCDTAAMHFRCNFLKLPSPCCKGNCEPNCAEWTKDFLGFDSGGIGLILTALFVQGALSLLLCLFIQSSAAARVRSLLSADRLWSAKSAHVRSGSLTGLDTRSWVKEDSDVIAERNHVLDGDLDALRQQNSLILRDVSHFYGSHRAVDRLSCAVGPAECFGLLGVNGAGKTTTFKMMTGDLPVTNGDAFINGASVTTAISEVQRNLGYCPQFDGLIDHLTGRETLFLFARLRGLREELIPTEVDFLITSLLLQAHADRLCGTYSGGNKRKLSTAMALVGGPAVVCLDEPTTGMDPVARRHLWRALANYRERGHTLILTSHSMEECEALCTKIAIMVNGQFKCFGACQHLKAKFGSGYSLLAQVPFDENTGDEYVRHLKEFVETHFPSAELIDVHQGVLHYQVHPDPAVSWAQVFGILERNKEALSLENYSVSQTTLEQVFLGFARSQIPPEETTSSCFDSVVRCLTCERKTQS